MRQRTEENWFVVSRPFTSPKVSEPQPDKDDAIALAEKLSGSRFTPKVRINDGEVWVGDSVVCSNYRLRVYGWDKGVELRLEPKRKKKNSRWG